MTDDVYSCDYIMQSNDYVVYVMYYSTVQYSIAYLSLVLLAANARFS